MCARDGVRVIAAVGLDAFHAAVGIAVIADGAATAIGERIEPDWARAAFRAIPLVAAFARAAQALRAVDVLGVIAAVFRVDASRLAIRKSNVIGDALRTGCRINVGWALIALGPEEFVEARAIATLDRIAHHVVGVKGVGAISRNRTFRRAKVGSWIAVVASEA